MPKPCKKWIPFFLGALIALLLIWGPIAYSRHLVGQYRNFRIVDDAKLYRSGQMTWSALHRTIEEYGIRTVISLRYAVRDGDRPPDWQEEEACKKLGIKYIRIRPREWSPDDNGSIPSQEPVDQFLKIMDDRSVYPVLIHCFAGMHRTGSYCALYRMEYQHWSNDEALNELKSLGYDNLDREEDVRGYLEAYVPRWRRAKAP